MTLCCCVLRLIKQIILNRKKTKFRMIDLKKLEVWFVTGSQHLYGEETLNKVAEHSQVIAKSFQ